MGRKHTRQVLLEKLGAGWETNLRNRLNDAPQHVTAARLGIGTKPLYDLLKTLGMERKAVYTLPGDVIVIRRGTDEIVVGGE